MTLLMSPLLCLSSGLVVIGTFLSISSSSWLGLWLGMEMNLFGFIILMNPEGYCVVEPCVKYFVIQSLGSMLILFGFLSLFYNFSWLSLMWVSLGLLMKSGIFPFHSWVPGVVMKSSWGVSGMILTWQKLAPMVFLSFISNSFFLYSSLVFMSLLGCMGGLNQNGIRAMSVYSSFVHTSWMLMALIYSFVVFLLYFIMYSISVILFFASCSIMGKSSLISQSLSWSGCLGLMMLSGVPPFVGFFGKFLVFVSCPSSLVIMCILGSIVSLKFYLSFFYSMILNSSKIKFFEDGAKLMIGLLLFNFSGALVTGLLFLS